MTHVTHSSQTTCNLTITADIAADCNEDADSLFEQIASLLSSAGLPIAPKQMWLELPWRSDAPVAWAHSCDTAVLAETFSTTLQAIRNNRTACNVTAQVLSRVIALPTVSFAALEKVVDMQRDIQQRAIDLDRLACNLQSVARQRNIELPTYETDTNLLELARHGAFERGGAWTARPDLDAAQVFEAAAGISDVPDDDETDCGVPPIHLIEATFGQTYVCAKPASQCV